MHSLRTHQFILYLVSYISIKAALLSYRKSPVRRQRSFYLLGFFRRTSGNPLLQKGGKIRNLLPL